jgi:hypothetical protein
LRVHSLLMVVEGGDVEEGSKSPTRTSRSLRLPGLKPL